MEDKMTIGFWTAQLDEMWLETMAIIHPGKDIDLAIRQSYGHLIASPTRLQTSTVSDFKRLVNTWLSNQRAEVKPQERKRRDMTNL